MSKRNYTHIQTFLPAIKEMIAAGKTQQEIAEHFGFKDKFVVKGLLKRQRRNDAKLEAGIVPKPKGRPRKGGNQGDIFTEQAHEINRLKMENKLLRDFLQSTERM